MAREQGVRVDDRTSLVWLALACAVAGAVLKFMAAAASGSSAVLAEAIHSLVLASAQGMMLVGLYRSSSLAGRPGAGEASPELHFWSCIVAAVLAALGAGVAIHEGVLALTRPHDVREAEFSIGLLATSAALSLLTLWRTLATRPAAADRQTDPVRSTLLLQAAGGIAGAVAAAAGLALAAWHGMAKADGGGAIAVGLILGAIAAILAIEVHALLAAEAHPERVCAAEARRELMAQVIGVPPPASRQSAPAEPIAAGQAAGSLPVAAVAAPPARPAPARKIKKGKRRRR